MGSEQQPFIISYHIRSLENSGTHGHDSDYPIGETTTARLYMLQGQLHFSMDRVGSYTLRRQVKESATPPL